MSEKIKFDEGLLETNLKLHDKVRYVDSLMEARVVYIDLKEGKAALSSIKCVDTYLTIDLRDNDYVIID